MRKGSQRNAIPSVVAAATVMAVATYAHAEETQVRVLDRLTITGDPDRIQEIPGSAQSLDRERLDRQGYTDPHRILREIPGVNVADEEGFGQFPHISMRGVPPERNSRITVMEDRVLAAPAPYSAPAAYYFPPMGRMDGVEVLKGSSSIKHGPYTTGGALNMRSTPLPVERSGKVDLLLGSNNGRRSHAHIGGTEGQWGWLLESFTEQSDGFKKLDNPLSGPNQPEPNTGFDRRNLMGKLGWTSDPADAVFQEVQFKFATDDRTINDTYLGLTEEDYNRNPYRRYRGSQFDEINTDHNLYHLQHYISLSADTDVTTDVYYADFVRNWYKLHHVAGTGITAILDDPDQFSDEISWIRGNPDDPSTRGNVRANNREYYSRGIQTRVTHLFEGYGWEHDLEVGLRYHEDEEDRLQWEDAFKMEDGFMVLDDGGEPGSTTNRVTDSRAIAAHIQNTMRRGAWTVTPGLRYETIKFTRRDYQEDPPTRSVTEAKRDNTYDVWIPGLGATYRIDENWSVLAGVHRGFAPAGPNPDLDEEKSTNLETGFRYRDRFTRAEVIGFLNDYDNIVAECTAVGGAGCEAGDAFSGGAVQVYGLEALILHDLGLSRGWAYHVPITLSYTYTVSEFEEDFGGTGPNNWQDAEKGDSLPEVPKHAVNLGIGLGRDTWRLDLNANYVTEAQARAGSDHKDQTIDSRVLLDLSGEYRVHGHARLFASVENLADQEYVVHHRPAGMRPGKPRELWAGVKVDF